jgi:hypothetical protein
MSEHNSLPFLLVLLVSSVSAFGQSPNGSGSQPIAPNTAAAGDSKPQPLMTAGQAVAQSIIDGQNATPPPLIFLPQPGASPATQASPWADLVSQAATAPFGLLLTGNQGLASAISNRIQEDPTGAVIDAFTLGSAVIAPAFPSSELAISVHSLGEDTLFSSGLTFAHAGIQGAGPSDAAQMVGTFALDAMGAGTSTKDIWGTLFTLGNFSSPQSTGNPDGASLLGSSSFETLPMQSMPTSGLANMVNLYPASDGTVIDSKLVPDSPPPDDGTTIQTQVVPNPSNGSIVAEGPITPISITSGFVANSPSPAAPSETGLPLTNSASGGGSQFDWIGFASTSLQIFGAIYGASHPATVSRSPAPARAIARANKGNANGWQNTPANSGSMCGPGYYVNPNFLSGLPWIAGQSLCVATGTTQPYH